jgi:hypothetical protein
MRLLARLIFILYVFKTSLIKHLKKYIYTSIFINVLIFIVRIKQKNEINKLKSKNKIKVLFIVVCEEIWKLNRVYMLMKLNPRFEPIILITPDSTYGMEAVNSTMNKAYNWFIDNNYNVLKSIKENGSWLNVKKEIEPDIIFFTNPHEITNSQYQIYNYKYDLTFYVPYSFQISDLYQMQYNRVMHNLVYRNFYESSFHLDIAKKYSKNKGRNVLVTGYPGVDDLIDRKYIPKNRWKLKDVKKIIWAPHHTILKEDDKVLPYSSFLRYCEIMINLAEDESKKILIAFKPHPMLKNKLYNKLVWGKEKTDSYFARWEAAPNGMLENGDYIDLFLTSDCIIHDSGSFLAEYLFVNKPAFFCVKSKETLSHFNEFGRLVLSNYYLINNEKELLDSIFNQILLGHDFLFESRTKFIENVLLPNESTSASDNIFNYINSLVN